MKRIFWGGLAGALSGLAVTLFLFAITAVTNLRSDNPWIVVALPIAGVGIFWTYRRLQLEKDPGVNAVVAQIQDRPQTLSPWMAPLIFASTLLTHLFGGSAGREGTAVQIGAGLADRLASRFQIHKEMRKNLLLAGAGSGFGAAIGAPIAGFIFGFEFSQDGRIRTEAWIESLSASLMAYLSTLVIAPPHQLWPQFVAPDISTQTIQIYLFAGLVFAILARLHITLTHQIERWRLSWPWSPLWVPFIGGAVLLIMGQLLGTDRYFGLGFDSIDSSLYAPAQWTVPLIKIAFTAITIGVGFKGGEFIPLVFVGATAGSFLSTLTPLSPNQLSTVGFAAVFAAASNTPIACAMMAIELFGIDIAPFVLFVCYVSFLFSNRQGLYAQQRHFLWKVFRV